MRLDLKGEKEPCKKLGKNISGRGNTSAEVQRREIIKAMWSVHSTFLRR